MAIGTNGDDTLAAAAAGEVLLGRLGDDFLLSAFGDTTLHGQGGDDTLETRLPDGNDRFFEASQVAEQTGGSGDDSLSATGGLRNWLLEITQDGGAGDDTLLMAGAERAFARGGGGADSITASVWAYTGALLQIDAGGGGDTVEAGLNASDVGYGRAYIRGGGGADSLRLTGSVEVSQSTLLGGAGADTLYSYVRSKDGSSVSIFADGGGGADAMLIRADGTSVGGAALHLVGGGGADDMTARPFAGLSQCTLEGGAGNDTLRCEPLVPSDGGGVDTDLRGGGGNDHLIGAIPRSFIPGFYDSYRLNQRFEGGAGNDLIEGRIGLYLEAFSHPTSSFAAYQSASGGAGDDTIVLTGGFDNLIDGGSGADLLQGSENADSILGGSGSDTLAGGSGADTLTGGPGLDTFVFARGDFGTTRITDWNGAQDRLDLELTDLNGNGLLDELAEEALYLVQGSDGYLVFSPEQIVVFEGARERRDFGIEDLFVDVDVQLI